MRNSRSRENVRNGQDENRLGEKKRQQNVFSAINGQPVTKRNFNAEGRLEKIKGAPIIQYVVARSFHAQAIVGEQHKIRLETRHVVPLAVKRVSQVAGTG